MRTLEGIKSPAEVSPPIKPVLLMVSANLRNELLERSRDLGRNSSLRLICFPGRVVVHDDNGSLVLVLNYKMSAYRTWQNNSRFLPKSSISGADNP